MKDLSEKLYLDKFSFPDTDFEKYKLLRFKIYENRIADIIQILLDNNFETILIKGWAAAQNYPKPYMRQIGDIDLAVNPHKFYEAQLFLKEMGNSDIDLHCGLRHLDTMDWDYSFEHSCSTKCGEVNVRVLRPEDHLRVLCVHWLNDGGAYKEKLWDIFYAVKNRPPDFDWEMCLNSVSKTRRKWIICAICLAQKYLGLNLDDTPLALEKVKIPKWLIKTIEMEWESDIRLLPLNSCLTDKQMLWRQLKKRFPPNALQATVEMEGEFDETSRLGYQIGNIFQRFIRMNKRSTNGFPVKSK